MPKYGKRAQSSRPPAVAPGERAPVLSSLAGDFVEYALAAESGQPLPVPCPRPQPQEQPKRSALDLLKWNAAALEGNKEGGGQRGTKRTRKGDDPSQLFIDAGQRDFASRTCKV
ncbi:hypothetical protein T484DRAFT_1915793 [Baffinella frigidus]|nr:hypothetical protein T484DRAFT_1915793 [Cryptophyta sp. CCMP2293]